MRPEVVNYNFNLTLLWIALTDFSACHSARVELEQSKEFSYKSHFVSMAQFCVEILIFPLTLNEQYTPPETEENP